MKDELARAAAAWPDLPAPDEGFERVLQARVAAGDRLDTLRVEDLFLTYHAAHGSAAAVAAVTALLEPLRTELRRTGADDQIIRDVLAELPADLVTPREGAAPRILGYSGVGPLQGWLRVVAVRAVVLRRKTVRSKPTEELFAERVAATHDPELEVLRAKYKVELQSAFSRALADLEAEQRLLLQQHHVDGLSIDKLAALHGIHRATAARRLTAAREALFESVRETLVSELRIGADTFDSIVRLVRSEVDLRLSQSA